MARPGDPPTLEPRAATPAAGAAVLRDPAPEALRDLQRLLSDAVQRLRRATGGDRSLAWALREDGRPYLAAADFEGDPPAAPGAEAFAALAALRRAEPLEGDPALEAIARESGCTAAAPVAAGGATALAVLLVAADPRPRVLAELDAAARQLEGPLAAALAAGRLRQLGEEARQLDRLASIGRLAAEIAHEVRNPLVTLQTFVELLPERRDDPAFLSEYLEVVAGELRRVNRLLDGLVDQARPPEPGDGPADPVEVARDLVRLLGQRAAACGVQLRIDAAEDAVPAALGEDALRQVLLNLALNAIEAAGEGGCVEIAVVRGSAGPELRVRDSGPGLPAEQREQLFEPFAAPRGDRSGGLGLAITRRLVEDAGGAIEIADAAGGGTEVRVSLRPAPATPPPRG